MPSAAVSRWFVVLSLRRLVSPCRVAIAARSSEPDKRIMSAILHRMPPQQAHSVLFVPVGSSGDLFPLYALHS